MTPTTLNALMGVLGTLGLTALTAAGAAYLLFRYLGDKWLTAKFGERLEAFKHAQQQELEQLRLRINATFDRTVKLHAYEFEVLPILWEKLNEAYNQTAGLTSPLQQFPDLDQLTGPAFEHFLGECGLPDYKKDELRSASDRTAQYQKMRFWQTFSVVSEAYNEFNRYFIAKGIFVQDPIKALVGELRHLMADALLEQETEHQFNDPREGRWELSRKFRKEGPEHRDAIEDAIHTRLWSATALPVVE